MQGIDEEMTRSASSGQADPSVRAAGEPEGPDSPLCSRHPQIVNLRAAKLTAMQRRYHVTTFGCQMNEHDSERMKGMLDSLGYVESAGSRGRRPDPLQHLLDP